MSHMSQRNGSAPRRTTRRTAAARSRPPVLCALLLGALATVTACGSDTGDGDSARRASSVTSASSAAPPSSPSAASSASAGSGSSRNERPTSRTAQSPPPSAGPSRPSSSRPAAASGVRRVCSKAQLTLAAGRMDTGAGNVYLPLVFTNKSATTCTLTGYPGVSLLDSTGAVIGDPATRRGPTRSPVSLPPGGSASSSLHTLNEGMNDTPCRRTAARIRVYPPDSFDAMNVSARSFRVCGGVFEVETTRSGTGG
ncbi:hypothetical protein D3C57_136520 [Streptomyces rapamycinicus NRRL 5491]|uniref:DUF4232 domain-containing protein n=1 Tax=Streptomyces rapamycinicus (strain ATCC 29253 / DSM 41530 / NRRL 5491 / AYB-994) TaxID=1343740 RepID=A0A3L8R655_STRRN|nr:hypothetical protein D3C57_136520 [Streptomyces rapamycinicus NRRL 5491]